jgi:hypothetical protein
LAAENDGEADANFANLRQCVPQREAADLPETPSAFDIRRIEMRENLVAALLEDRRVAIAHLHTSRTAARRRGRSIVVWRVGADPANRQRAGFAIVCALLTRYLLNPNLGWHTGKLAHPKSLIVGVGVTNACYMACTALSRYFAGNQKGLNCPDHLAS